MKYESDVIHELRVKEREYQAFMHHWAGTRRGVDPGTPMDKLTAVVLARKAIREEIKTRTAALREKRKTREVAFGRWDPPQ